MNLIVFILGFIFGFISGFILICIVKASKPFDFEENEENYKKSEILEKSNL